MTLDENTCWRPILYLLKTLQYQIALRVMFLSHNYSQHYSVIFTMSCPERFCRWLFFSCVHFIQVFIATYLSKPNIAHEILTRFVWENTWDQVPKKFNVTNVFFSIRQRTYKCIGTKQRTFGNTCRDQVLLGINKICPK